MSKYVSTVWELAKKYNQPTSEFLSRLKEFDIGITTHLQKLTQEDVDLIMSKFYPAQSVKKEDNEKSIMESFKYKLINPNVTVTKGHQGVYIISLIDTEVDELGKVVFTPIKTYSRTSKLEALVAFDQLRTKYNLDSTVDE